MYKAKTVQEYIAQAPEHVRNKLRELSELIIQAAPFAQERMSYDVPHYSDHSMLTYFAYHKTHIGLYVSPSIIASHAKELEEYETAHATVRFPLQDELPSAIITKLIRAGIEKNEIKHERKTKSPQYTETLTHIF